MPSNFESFSYFQVVGQSSLFFVLHIMNYSEVIFVEAVVTVLIMLGDAGVVPLLVVDGSFMLFPADFACPVSLADVD